MKHAYSFTQYFLRPCWFTQYLLRACLGIRQPTAGVLTPVGPLLARPGLREDGASARSPGRQTDLSSADVLPAHPCAMWDKITTVISLVMNQVTKHEVKGDTRLRGLGPLLPFFIPVPDLPVGQVPAGTDSAGEMVALPQSLRTFPGKPSAESRIGDPSACSLNHSSFRRHEVGVCQVELTVLTPCLNEAETVATRVRKAVVFLVDRGVDGEVVVADNGSTDGSQQLAEAAGMANPSLPCSTSHWSQPASAGRAPPVGTVALPTAHAL